MAQSARLKAGTIFVPENVEAKIWIGVLPLGQDWRVCSNEGIEHADSLQAAALSDTASMRCALWETV